ncbi:hypothetical protein EJ05DRAFT_479734 [Pseudovirgaria hyperparasitica]|uniref:DNA helicase n=1 Tax=Pseudovirgaria hyperparasitica TaxID=470096 RepID=A0A6A6VVE7_9PEZI|nr:uncharacterized protein EJ05DRAFT_479734 [Pseudovirgaria hyperparasitica]KAF2754203.1 hypothetical protein EJ05DRAFT_479734 [Pseudovirgaria hyperparasitica]
MAHDDFDDDIVDEYITQATVPLDAPISRPKISYGRLQDQISPPTGYNPQSTYSTQPTQLLGTPPRRAPNVQVAASSPFQSSPYAGSTRYGYHSSHSSQHMPSQETQRLIHSMAPRGTFVAIPKNRIVDASQGVAPGEDEPILAENSEDELSRNVSRANIPRTSFKTGSNPHIVPETSRSFDPSQFIFKGVQRKQQQNQQQQNQYQVPQKRQLDDSVSAYANASSSSKRRLDHGRQMGPARAQPVECEMSLDDIPDWHTRKLVEEVRDVTHKSIIECYKALQECRNHSQDAMDKLLSQSPSPSPKHSSVAVEAPSKPTMKRQVVDKGSITQKYSRQGAAQGMANRPRIVHTIPSSSPPLPVSPPKKTLKRLKRRPRAASSSDVEAAETKLTSVIDILSDEEPVIVESSDDHAADDVPYDFKDRLLKFFNSRDALEIADLAQQTIEVAELIVSKRPFRNLSQVREVALPSPPDSGKGKKRSKPKPIGERIVDVCEDMLAGLEAVDELVDACNREGNAISKELGKWGINVDGLALEGEVAITSLGPSSAKDSGTGTPEPSKDIMTADLLKQPSNMSKDIVLKDYQLVGLNWLSLLWKLKLSCILADDMGLGKTCQVIAFISHLSETGVEGPHLIIVPGSTLENWLREFKTFSPNLVVEPYYGSLAERAEQRETIEQTIDRINVVVTTYDCACRDPDNKFLRRIGAEVCVYDEGHMLKNSTTKRYQQLIRIKAKHRLLLTGTPLQNNLQELISLLAFLMPDTFMEHQEQLLHVFKHKTKITDSDHSSLLSQKRIQRARAMIAPFILRRKKQQVLKHLPAKHHRVVYCDLSETQKKLYDAQLAQQRKVLEDRAAGIANNDRALNLMRLRQAAIHPLLLRHIYDDTKLRKVAKALCTDDKLPDRNEQLVYEDIEYYSDYAVHQLLLKFPRKTSRFMLKNSECMNSGKVEKLAELLKTFQTNGDRALIFSQFTTVMDILEQVLEELNMPFLRMDGSTPIPQRQDMLDEFYKDESIPVFMLSTKSGGAGINLACANKVIIFDSSFNPQDDIQAENRAHRVGQTREVEVIRLVTKDTIEEQILRLGLSKMALDDRVAGEAEDKKGKAMEEKGMELVERMIMGEEVEELTEVKRPNVVVESEEDRTNSKKSTKSKDSPKDAKDAFTELLKKKGVSLAK